MEVKKTNIMINDQQVLLWFHWETINSTGQKNITIML